MDELTKKVVALASELIHEYGQDYVLFCLKKINEQQGFDLEIPGNFSSFEPVLKVLDIILTEFDNVMYCGENGVESMNDVRKIVIELLKMPELANIQQLTSSQREQLM